LGCSFSVFGVFHAVGDDDGGVVQQPVEDAEGGGQFGPEPDPLLEGPVLSDGQGAALGGAGDEPEESTRSRDSMM
jgi:hypothetical protein